MRNELKLIMDRLEKIEAKINLLVSGVTTQFSGEDLMSLEEAAKFLNVAKSTMYHYCSQSKIPHMKRGKKLTFSKIELTDWLQNSRRKPLEEINQSV